MLPKDLEIVVFENTLKRVVILLQETSSSRSILEIIQISNIINDDLSSLLFLLYQILVFCYDFSLILER